MTIQEIKDTFNNCLDQIDKTKYLFVRNPLTDFTRKRCLAFRTMMRIIIEMGADSLDKELLHFFDFSEKVPSASALSQQRSKILSEAFSYLFSLFNESMPFQKTTDGYHLIAADGSNINIAYNPDDPSTFIQPKDEEIRGA